MAFFTRAQIKKKACNDNSKIAICALVKIVPEDIRFIIPRNSYTDVLQDTWPSV